MSIVLNILLFLTAAVFMEGVAWFTHKYVMHGFLWVLHRDHHQPKGRGLQRNDLFAVFFASISIALIAAGAFNNFTPAIFLGAGVALYGLGYFLFHEVMVHRRIPGLRIKPFTPYLEHITEAHHIHHRNPNKEGGVSFSFLYAPQSVVEEHSQ
jgi:beta-carotene 3-hydroxylase